MNTGNCHTPLREYPEIDTGCGGDGCALATGSSAGGGLILLILLTVVRRRRMNP
jgi:MYXO-CTERM domain-containing protein